LASPSFDNWDFPTKVNTFTNTNSVSLTTEGAQMVAGSLLTVSNVKPAPGNFLSIEVFYKGDENTITNNGAFI